MRTQYVFIKYVGEINIKMTTYFNGHAGLSINIQKEELIKLFI